MSDILDFVGKKIPLRQGYAKVTGLEKFASDRSINGTLPMKILRSPYPHAKIRSIDTSQAEKLPGVFAVVTYKDVPQNEISATVDYEIRCAMFNWRGKVLDDRVRFVGDEVAAVAADCESTAEEACNLIKVEYEQLPYVFDMEKAEKSDAPDVRGAGTNVVTCPPEPGSFNSHQEWGDLEKGFKESDAMVTFSFNSQSIYGGFFPPACIAEWDADKLTIMLSHQCPFEIREITCKALGLPESKVRIIAPLLAGSFGMMNSGQRFWCIAALASKKANRPVSYRMTLEEFGVYKRRENDVIRGKIAGKQDGTLTALEFENLHDNGGYGWKGTNYGTVHDIFPHAAVKFFGRGINTNRITSGCIRGVGDVPQTPALNLAVDLLCEKLNVDPIAFWKKNHTRTGDPRRCDNFPGPDRTVSSEGFDEMIDKGAISIGWKQKWKGWGVPYYVNGPKRRGVGVALSLHASSVPIIQGAATIRVNHDGSAEVSVGFTDLGTGSKTTYAQIAAETLGISLDNVYVVRETDTETVPFASMTGASSGLHLGGSAVELAARDAKKQILEMALTGWWSPEIIKKDIGSIEELDIRQNMIFVKKDPSRSVALKDVLGFIGGPMVIGRANRHGIPFNGPLAYITMVCYSDIEVDIETGKIEVLKIATCHDSGRIINPAVCENQVFGGTSMSFGFALMEEIAFDPATGKPLNPALSDYWWPTSLDMPDTDCIFSENIDPVGPYGAKGIGEAPACTPHAAILSAFYNAAGVRITSLPLTPDKIMKALGRAQ